MDNRIYFENGIVHYLEPEEITVIRKALKVVGVEEENREALENLKSLFFEYLD